MRFFGGKEPSFRRKKVPTVLNRRRFPAGRLLVSCRAFGSLNRPLAALAFGAPNPPFSKKAAIKKEADLEPVWGSNPLLYILFYAFYAVTVVSLMNLRTSPTPTYFSAFPSFTTTSVGACLTASSVASSAFSFASSF